MRYKENAMILSMKGSIAIVVLFTGLLVAPTLSEAQTKKHSSTTEIHSTVSIVNVPDVPLVQANPVLIGSTQSASSVSAVTTLPTVSFWTKVKNFFGRLF